ncbi:acetolactate decarboxylase [Salegentibacter salegens]|uniref:Alpha-acetolactate decarboxylase n=1 Tax=Salegentibacter salegens TaxID=143223 RepID=A0A1M7LJL5_9FLAO|nr:acetolactate decarboxylase [Salegentibacter salegens]PRX50692.1 acetolactate decarboxylase [Salegentibacter salegens]SHM78222.1 acetolactate decarboxylase [Salegentibacter salegens]
MKGIPPTLLLLGFLTGFSTMAQNSSVNVAGAMKNVMKKGELHGTISLDSVAKKGVYGLGPVEFLSGELLILDGEVFKSSVENKNSMQVEKTSAVKAPFFVYAEVEKWKSVSLPNSLNSLERLENFLNEMTPESAEAFPFRLKGKINSAKIHIVNLPQGRKVSSPKEAHEGLTNYTLEDKEIEILGFFSRKHQAVFTHHNTYMHLHLITEDEKQMGHLDQLEFDANNLKLYLPE